VGGTFKLLFNACPRQSQSLFFSFALAIFWEQLLPHPSGLSSILMPLQRIFYTPGQSISVPEGHHYRPSHIKEDFLKLGLSELLVEEGVFSEQQCLFFGFSRCETFTIWL
jgi:hypothetical protein